MAKRIFISDVHIGARRKPKNGRYAYDWFPDEKSEALKGFLDCLNKNKYPGGDVKEVILLGDVMDNWICPHNDDPPTFDEIKKANSILFDSINALASKNIDVYYIPGNHDMTITKDFVNANFPGVRFGGNLDKDSYQFGSRLLAQHGNAYSIFNAPNRISTSLDNLLPLGYYISRVYATINAVTGKKAQQGEIIKETWESLENKDGIAEAAFDAFLRIAGLDDRTLIKMPNGYADVTAGEIKSRYSNLYTQWDANNPPVSSYVSYTAEAFSEFIDIARKLSDEKTRRNIIIFGHTHYSKCGLEKKNPGSEEERIYANSGTWCNDSDVCTFIETEVTEDDGFHHVRVNSWQNNAVNEISSVIIGI